MSTCDCAHVQTRKEDHAAPRTARESNEILGQEIWQEPWNLAIRCFLISSGNVWCKRLDLERWTLLYVCSYVVSYSSFLES